MEKQKSTVILGSYPQRGAPSSKEPIEWIVLKQEDNRILCASKYLLDCIAYHETLEPVTWEKCTLRKWLNHDFFDTAFSKEEQSRILLTDVETPLHDTKDYLFTISCDEAEQYFNFNQRAAKTTGYARKRGAWFLEDKDNKYVSHGSWWLRYPELLEDEDEQQGGLYTVLSCVNYDGYIEGAADEVTATTCCIRPAMWIQVE